MNKNFTVFLILLLLCSDIFCVPIIDDISSSISNAWQQLITAIKKPGRYGRKKRRRNKKLKLKITTIATTETLTSSVDVFRKKLSLPVLPHPQWMSLDKWTMPLQPGLGIIPNMPNRLDNDYK